MPTYRNNGKSAAQAIADVLVRHGRGRWMTAPQIAGHLDYAVSHVKNTLRTMPADMVVIKRGGRWAGESQYRCP